MSTEFKHPPFLTAIYGDILRLLDLKYTRPKHSLFHLTFILCSLSPFLYPNYIYRLSVLFYFPGFPYFSLFLSRLNLLFFGLEISPQCIISPGVFFPHPRGTIIGAYYIGSNATIYHRVTLGSKRLAFDYSSRTRPIIYDNVILGCGSTILGGVSIGNNSIISANTLVTRNIPPFNLVKSSQLHLSALAHDG